jgi:soluble cytochrome b562
MKLILCGFAAALMHVQPVMAETTPLAKEMEAMNDAYKAMRRETDPAKGAELARQAQDAMIKAIVELPSMVKAMPDGPDKAKASASYRKMMGGLIATLADMELAFLNGDLDKVKEIVTAMRDIKKDGHDKFMEE